MTKKMQATVEPLSPGEWRVTVTDVDYGEVHILTIKAATEKEAAFTAMEQINDR